MKDVFFRQFKRNGNIVNCLPSTRSNGKTNSTNPGSGRKLHITYEFLTTATYEIWLGRNTIYRGTYNGIRKRFRYSANRGHKSINNGELNRKRKCLHVQAKANPSMNSSPVCKLFAIKRDRRPRHILFVLNIIECVFVHQVLDESACLHFS